MVMVYYFIGPVIISPIHSINLVQQEQLRHMID